MFQALRAWHLVLNNIRVCLGRSGFRATVIFTLKSPLKIADARLGASPSTDDHLLGEHGFSNNQDCLDAVALVGQIFHVFLPVPYPV